MIQESGDAANTADASITVSIPAGIRPDKKPVISVRRIEGGISAVNSGCVGSGGSGSFQRIDPKFSLVEELEWKPAQPNYLRHIAFMVALLVSFFAYLGFKLQKDLGISIGPKLVAVAKSSKTTQSKVLGFPKDPGENGFRDASELVRNIGSVKYHGQTLKERMAACALRTSLDLVIQIQLRDWGGKHGPVEVVTCCHEGKEATAFLVNVAGIRKGEANEGLRARLAEYAWAAAANCAGEIDATTGKNVLMALQLDGEFDRYMIGRSFRDDAPDTLGEKEARTRFHKEFATWPPTASR